MDEVAESHKPITIKGEHNDAVLISREDWNAITQCQASPDRRNNIS